MSVSEDKVKLMRDAPIPEVLMKLGIPTMIGMVVSALYNVVDAYFVGGLGTTQMGAVSVAFPIGQVIVGLGMMFGSGGASYLSRLLGEGEDKRADEVASTALITGLAVGIVIIAAALCFMDKILLGLGATVTILPYARAYAVIYVASSILNIFNVTMNNIITAEGAAKRALVAMLVGCGGNAILDPLFIYTFGWGIEGAAWATAAAQALSAILYIDYIAKGKSHFTFAARNIRPNATDYGKILSVGFPILIFQFLTSVTLGLTNTAANRYGDSAVAAMGIATRILTLGTYVIFGYMKGFQPVAGYNYGARNYARLDEATNTSLKWATGFCAVVAALMIAIPKPIIALFSRDAAVLEIGSSALRANGFLFALFGFQMMHLSRFLALGKGREGGILSISRQGIFFIPAILILPRLFGLSGIIWAQPAADALSVCLTAVLASRLDRELKSLKKNEAEMVERTA